VPKNPMAAKDFLMFSAAPRGVVMRLPRGFEDL
jgi:hypothetical protein